MFLWWFSINWSIVSLFMGLLYTINYKLMLTPWLRYWLTLGSKTIEEEGKVHINHGIRVFVDHKWVTHTHANHFAKERVYKDLSPMYNFGKERQLWLKWRGALNVAYLKTIECDGNWKRFRIAYNNLELFLYWTWR